MGDSINTYVFKDSFYTFFSQIPIRPRRNGDLGFEQKVKETELFSCIMLCNQRKMSQGIAKQAQQSKKILFYSW